MKKNFIKSSILVFIFFLLFNKLAVANILPIVNFDRVFDDYNPENIEWTEKEIKILKHEHIYFSSSKYKRNLGKNLSEILSEYDNNFWTKRDLKLKKIDILNNYKILSLYNQPTNKYETDYVFDNNICIGYYIFDSKFSIRNFGNYPITLQVKSFPKNNNDIQGFNLLDNVNISIYVSEHDNFVEKYVITNAQERLNNNDLTIVTDSLYFTIDAFYPKELETFFKARLIDNLGMYKKTL